MIITISGLPGSGKSTLAKELAKLLKFKHYSMGDLQRSIAKEKGITITELGALEEKDSKIDNEIEAKQEKLGKTEDDFIIDGRLSFHFIPNSVKIFLTVTPEIGAERILKNRRDEEQAEDIEELKEKIQERIESEKKRFKEYYNINPYDESNYDFVLDTNNLTVEECLEQVKEFVENY